jgi:tetratricopeptide (TPR) repeat protein
VSALLNLMEIKDAKNSTIDTLRKHADEVRSIASSISAQDISKLVISPGPATILSIGLPLIGIYLAKKKHDSPLARKIARFLGADVSSINEQFVFEKLKSGEYYNELRKNFLAVVTERGDISPLTKMLSLTDGEAWEIFRAIKDIIFSEEVLNQFSIIVPSLEQIKKDVTDVKSNLNSLLDALKGPIKVSKDAVNIASELRVHESIGVSYIRRREDNDLEQAIINNDNKIILIIGGPGSGKSKMLYNALMYCREYFSTFILIKSYFKEGDEKSLDIVLRQNDKDNFVIVWDDLHEKETPNFVTDIIERINGQSTSKNFRFIGASRKDIFVRGEGVCRVNLSRFDKVEELVSESTKAFNVKLKHGATSNEIASKGDGTPYYTISLFKMFKDSEISLEGLDQLPSDVTALWLNYLEIAIQNSRINANHLNAFRSIGLLSHASAEPSQITKHRIYEIYNSVFHGDLGELDYALNDLVDNMFVSWVDEGYYYAHQSHIEALERKYPLEKYHVQNFTKHESDSRDLWRFANWAYYKRKMDYMETISSRILELDPNDASASFNKGLALSELGRYEEVVACYDKVLELKPNNIGARINKGSALDNLGKHNEAIQYFDEALQLSNDEEPLLLHYDKHDFDKDTGRLRPGIYNIVPDPNKLSAWFNKGLALSGLGKYKEAIGCYDEAIKLDPYFVGAWSSKGLALYNLGNYEEAVACCDKALDIAPNDPYIWYNRAYFKFKKGDIENGFADLKNAIEINKDLIEYVKKDSFFNNIKDDEKFKALIMKI